MSANESGRATKTFVFIIRVPAAADRRLAHPDSEDRRRTLAVRAHVHRPECAVCCTYGDS